MCKFFCRLLLIIICLFCGVCSAEASTGLSSATVIVSDRSDAVRHKAFEQAFARVMVRMSGNPTIMTIPQVQNSLADIKQFVVSYSYQVKNLDSVQSRVLVLQVVFDSVAIKHLLQSTGQVYWRGVRPTTLVLVKCADGEHEVVLSSEETKSILQHFRRAAHQVGLDVLFPTMDLSDQMNLTDKGMLHIGARQIRQLMQRYQVKSILVVHWNHTNTSLMQMDWSLWLLSQHYQWQSSAPDRLQAIQFGMNHLLELLARQYAVINTPKLQNDVLVRINDVQGLQDYLQVVDDLRSLPSVNRVAVKDMASNALLLQLSVSGGVHVLIKALRTEPALVPESVPANTGDVSMLFYRWNKKSQVIEHGSAVNTRH